RDWSSDVCSSDLEAGGAQLEVGADHRRGVPAGGRARLRRAHRAVQPGAAADAPPPRPRRAGRGLPGLHPPPGPVPGADRRLRGDHGPGEPRHRPHRLGDAVVVPVDRGAHRPPQRARARGPGEHRRRAGQRRGGDAPGQLALAAQGTRDHRDRRARVLHGGHGPGRPDVLPERVRAGAVGPGGVAPRRHRGRHDPLRHPQAGTAPHRAVELRGRRPRRRRGGRVAGGGARHRAGGRADARVGPGRPHRRGRSVKVTVVGLGKIGLPLAVQIAGRGHHTVGADVDEAVVRAVEEARPPFPNEADLDERLAKVVADGLLTATTDTAAAVAGSDVVVVVVPLYVDADRHPAFSAIDAATREVGRGLRPGTLVTYETTLPVGTTRNRIAPGLGAASGLRPGADFSLAFSPERVSSGRVFCDLARYPKLVGGIDEESGRRAAVFYASALDFDDRDDLPRPNGVWDLGSAEAAELAKLAETTYRDVNIALANQFA